MKLRIFLFSYFVDEEILDSSSTSKILITQTDLQLRELKGKLR